MLRNLIPANIEFIKNLRKVKRSITYLTFCQNDITFANGKTKCISLKGSYLSHEIYLTLHNLVESFQFLCLYSIILH